MLRYQNSVSSDETIRHFTYAYGSPNFLRGHATACNVDGNVASAVTSGSDEGSYDWLNAKYALFFHVNDRNSIQGLEQEAGDEELFLRP